MINTAAFVTRLAQSYERYGLPAYNEEQIESIVDYISKNVTSERMASDLLNNIRYRFKDRPLIEEISAVYNDLSLDYQEPPKAIGYGDAMKLYEKISSIREMMLNGKKPTLEEMETLSRFSRFEFIVGALLDEGRADEAIEIGNEIKIRIEQGYKIPAINIVGVKDIRKYFRAAVEVCDKKNEAIHNERTNWRAS